MYGVASNHHVLGTRQALPLGRTGTPLYERVTSQLARGRGTKQTRTHRLIAALSPAFPNQPDLSAFQWPSTSALRVGSQGEPERQVKAGAKEKWPKHNESALSSDSPLSLPLAYPGTEPATQKERDAMVNCNPEVQVGFLSFALRFPAVCNFTFPLTIIDQFRCTPTCISMSLSPDGQFARLPQILAFRFLAGQLRLKPNLC